MELTQSNNKTDSTGSGSHNINSGLDVIIGNTQCSKAERLLDFS
ncbi:hypothetical protein [Photobacterium aquimaris]|nr:hypothetical protein [Photobacterium aquimaris]